MSWKLNGKRIAGLLMAVLLIACMMVMAVVPVAAEVNDQVRDDANGVFVITSWVKVTGTVDDVRLENYPLPVYQGSAFLINTNTVLTCAHIIDPDSIQDYIEHGSRAGIDLRVNDIYYEITLNKDVTITCSLKKHSVADDYAVLTLNEPIAGKSVLKLADSSKVVPTQKVYALGFPALVTELQIKVDVPNQTYDKDDVTFTEGDIQKVTRINNTDVFQHGSSMYAGHSGGPLVDANGNVIGVNKWLVPDSNDGVHYATAINEVKVILDSLMIEYTEADDPAIAPTEDKKSDETVKEDSTEAETEKVTEAPTTSGNGNDTDKKKDSGNDTKTIIVIAIIALVVILIAVVIVIIVVSAKKKNNGPKNGPQGGAGTPVMPPTAPQVPQRPNTPYAQPYSRPQMPQGGAPTMPSNDGAGETSVLNEGAGETTVLGGNQATGFTLLRKSNNERININKPEFTIGKERRRVDYCIENNNSVSRTHAKIKVRSGVCYIADLGSTNCTFVNGSKIAPNQEVALNKGDKIKISDEEFELI